VRGKGGFLKSPLTPLYERGENTPTLSLPPLRGRMRVGGKKYKSSPSHRKRYTPHHYLSPRGRG